MGLWQVLKTADDAQNIANVESLVEYAAGKLILIRETFPDYTRHDEQHAENVIALIEKLLGPAIEHLTPLEAAMLILAAYFHDMGMVYHPDELAALVEEEDFRGFLDDNPTAYVQVHQAGEIPQDVIIQYCRARHADRAAEHIFQLRPGVRTWDDIGIGEELAVLCQSHMQPLDELRTGKFPTAFRGSCDLLMCAILLRLADILDLDDTRSPAAVYAHLRLAGSAEGPRAVSNAEWCKHLASRGFRFPAERTPNYRLMFLASPQKPSVENAIRRFLDVVEEELRGCRILLDFCAPRWRTLALPGSVDRSDIVSDGYRYGEYRFVLDRTAVLRLFMGDQLYSDPYTFVRELLQNAIDACRLNVYLHDADPATMEVRISAWEDDAGNYWLRVDDTGVGMDQGIVEKYFLGVGRSYYRSDELQADILRKNKPQQRFVAISRFGIGVLSSFIVGDRIEVSTRRRMPDGKLAAPLRLSLDSLDDFFVMQDPPMRPDPFPGRNGPDTQYRKTAGTSVAVRIDPTKSDVALDELLERVRKWLFFPPARIYLNDVEQRGCGLAELDVPLLDGPVHHPVSADADTVDAALLAATPVSVIAISLNLTANAPFPSIRGQLIAVRAEADESTSLLPALPAEIRDELPPDLADSLQTCIQNRGASASWSRGHDTLDVLLQLQCDAEALRRLSDWLRETRHYVTKGWTGKWVNVLEDALERGRPTRYPSAQLSAAYSVTLSDLAGETAARLLATSPGWLGHNGINVPTRRDLTGYPFRDKISLTSIGDIFGFVGLFDELRPDVSVSRDTLRGLSFDIQSAIHMTVRRAANVYLDSAEKHFAQVIRARGLLVNSSLPGLTVGQMEADPLAAEWRGEQLFRLQPDKALSAAEIRSLARSGPVSLTLPLVQWSQAFLEDPEFGRQGFYDTLRVAIAERELDVELTKTLSDGPHTYEVTVQGAERPARAPGLSVLPPLSVVRYPSAQILIAPWYPANLRHPIVAWFADHAADLSADYPALFAQFKRALAAIANLFLMGEPRQLADGAADLLNGTLDRIRRSVPNVPDALSQEIYADESFQLRSR